MTNFSSLMAHEPLPGPTLTDLESSQHLTYCSLSAADGLPGQLRPWSSKMESTGMSGGTSVTKTPRWGSWGGAATASQRGELLLVRGVSYCQSGGWATASQG